MDLSMVPDCNYDHAPHAVCVIDLIVENLGRSNFGKPHTFDQKKGLLEDQVFWDAPRPGEFSPMTHWEIIPLEFKGDWVSR